MVPENVYSWHYASCTNTNRFSLFFEEVMLCILFLECSIQAPSPHQTVFHSPTGNTAAWNAWFRAKTYFCNLRVSLTLPCSAWPALLCLWLATSCLFRNAHVELSSKIEHRWNVSLWAKMEHSRHSVKRGTAAMHYIRIIYLFEI